jgi:L-2-aminoadipate reductase
MLSGIAHDPIQRDMFTPIFLGGSLWVPTSEDIGNPSSLLIISSDDQLLMIGIPGRLAEWMKERGVNVTHLTPGKTALPQSSHQ